MPRSFALPCLFLLALSGCHGQNSSAAEAGYEVPSLLRLPRQDGWTVEPVAPPEAASDAPPVALRLVRESAVPGSPRLTVVAEAASTGPPTALEAYLTRNLRDMGQLESAGQIRIMDVEQKRISVAGQPAFRVRHEYTLGSGAAQIAITQISLFLVIQGRGVTVTVAGRTELFHPVAQSIQAMLQGLVPLVPARSNSMLERLRSTVDLGHIGGG